MSDRIETLGLSENEVDCVRKAAGREWEVVVGTLSMFAHTDEFAERTVRVSSLACLEAMHADSAASAPVSNLRLVLLLPADACGERQRWSAHVAAKAHIVLTKLPSTVLALHEALHKVRYDAVAQSIVGRFGKSRDDLPSRALVAAVRLAPSARNVPSLARMLHMTERTLRRQLDAACPNLAPHRLPNWACVLHSAWHLGASYQSFERVAQQAGASAPSNLHRLLRAYTGYSAGELRAMSSEPIATALAAWRAELSGTKSSSQKRRLRASASDGADSKY